MNAGQVGEAEKDLACSILQSGALIAGGVKINRDEEELIATVAEIGILQITKTTNEQVGGHEDEDAESDLRGGEKKAESTFWPGAGIANTFLQRPA